MDVNRLKEYIIDNSLYESILEHIGCHHIRDKGTYLQCANPDGDNISAITLYKSNLNVVDYTRDLESVSYIIDIFTLVQFFLKCNFFNAIKTVCEWINVDYYYDFDAELPQSLQLTKLLISLNTDNSEIVNEEKPVKKISENILTYYKPYVNDLFFNDYISYQTQALFEIGYDEQTNRITIPIRDEIGSLVGVKGRLFGEIKESEDIDKYLYLEPCSKGQILYGLDKAYESLKQQNMVYVVEAEKGVLQMFSYGLTNVVATCGKKITQTQINKLSRLCVDICFLYDKDVSLEEIKAIAEKFICPINIYCVIDKDNLLDKKESPTDNPNKLHKLLKKSMIKIKG